MTEGKERNFSVSEDPFGDLAVNDAPVATLPIGPPKAQRLRAFARALRAAIRCLISQ